jgi:hypothetical protein
LQPTEAECQEKGRQYFGRLNVDITNLGEHASSIIKLVGDKEMKRQSDSSSKESNLRREWLNEHHLNEDLSESADQLKEKIKWIDAKKLFTESMQSNGLGEWKKVFSENNKSYARYFNSIDPKDKTIWPDDFVKLTNKFRKFLSQH